MNELKLFYVQATANVVVEYIDIWARSEEETYGEIICAPSRGKARALFALEYNLDFTYPMIIRGVQHFLTQDELVEGWFLSADGFFVNDDNNYVLHHENQLDDLLSA